MSPPRNDIETTTPARPSCPVCGAGFTRNRRHRYCSSACRRVDLGGLCPHCDEPVAIIDLLDQHLPPSTHQT
jgi:hypothetical protein